MNSILFEKHFFYKLPKREIDEFICQLSNFNCVYIVIESMKNDGDFVKTNIFYNFDKCEWERRVTIFKKSCANHGQSKLYRKQPPEIIEFTIGDAIENIGEIFKYVKVTIYGRE